MAAVTQFQRVVNIYIIYSEWMTKILCVLNMTNLNGTAIQGEYM